MDDSSPINNLKLIDVYHFHHFKYLHIKDVVNLRPVSKTFRYIVDSYEIKELVFTFDEDTRFDIYLASSGKLRCRLGCSKLDQVIKSAYLLNLKDLSIYSIMCSSELEEINKFTKLRRLKLYNLHMFSDNPSGSDNKVCLKNKLDSRNHKLKLPDLIELEITPYRDDNRPAFYLEIDTPSLQKLYISFKISRYSLNNVKISHPLSIKYLQTMRPYENVSALSNLECLELSIYEFGGIKMLYELLKLKNLKELSISFISGLYLKKAIDELKDVFKSKKDDLDIVLYGVKIKKINKLDEFKKYKDDEALKFQVDNYDELEDDPHLIIKVFDYIKFMKLSPNKLPSDLFKKYANIKRIGIYSSIDDEDRLIHFIKGCKKLYELDIKNASLSQHFYDQLPAISSLVSLKIEDYGFTTEFTEKMPHLFYKKFYLYDIEDDLDDLDELDLDDRQI